MGAELATVLSMLFICFAIIGFIDLRIVFLIISLLSIGFLINFVLFNFFKWIGLD